MVTVLDALIKDFTGKLADVCERRSGDQDDAARRARARSRSTAAPRSRRTPTGRCSRGNGPYDYVCVECGNVLAGIDAGRVHEPQGPRPLRAAAARSTSPSRRRASTTPRGCGAAADQLMTAAQRATRSASAA